MTIMMMVVVVAAAAERGGRWSRGHGAVFGGELIFDSVMKQIVGCKAAAQ
jgi:hypothetical protein